MQRLDLREARISLELNAASLDFMAGVFAQIAKGRGTEKSAQDLSTHTARLQDMIDANLALSTKICEALVKHATSVASTEELSEFKDALARNAAASNNAQDVLHKYGVAKASPNPMVDRMREWKLRQGLDV